MHVGNNCKKYSIIYGYIHKLILLICFFFLKQDIIQFIEKREYISTNVKKIKIKQDIKNVIFE